MSFHVPEKFRVINGTLPSTPANGNNGFFLVHSLKLKRVLKCLASDGMRWEHVSVSLHDRLPTWDEMCIIKSLFWDDEDTVIQYHPPKSEYVNNHEYCLHLWRPLDVDLILPPSILVGVK